MRILRRDPARDFRHACIDDQVYAEIDRLKRTGFVRNGVVIGTLALNFYVKPRYTNEIDLLIPGNEPIEAFQGRQGGVEFRLLTPDAINITDTIAANMFATAILRDGMMVASREGLIALKLFNAAQSARWFYQESADIVSLLMNHDIDLAGWDLKPEHLNILAECRLMAG